MYTTAECQLSGASCWLHVDNTTCNEIEGFDYETRTCRRTRERGRRLPNENPKGTTSAGRPETRYTERGARRRRNSADFNGPLCIPGSRAHLPRNDNKKPAVKTYRPPWGGKKKRLEETRKRNRRWSAHSPLRSVDGTSPVRRSTLRDRWPLRSFTGLSVRCFEHCTPARTCSRTPRIVLTGGGRQFACGSAGTAADEVCRTDSQEQTFD